LRDASTFILGNGFQEVIYQRALALEMSKAGLGYARELEMPIYYKEYQEQIGLRRVDFLAEDKVLVELKAIGQIEDVHVVQILNYIKAYKIRDWFIDQLWRKKSQFQKIDIIKSVK